MNQRMSLKYECDDQEELKSDCRKAHARKRCSALGSSSGRQVLSRKGTLVKVTSNQEIWS
jgi:hypothetical protein